MAINQMPHNLEAESAILGCILIDGDIQSELLETLREEDFYQESNRLVLDAMKKVYAARKPASSISRSSAATPSAARSSAPRRALSK